VGVALIPAFFMRGSAMGKKILVVDDEPDIVAYLSAILEDNGYEVITASDGEQGLKAASQQTPELIMLDITMPGTTGVRAYRSLKEDPVLRKIPVIIVTGVSHDFKHFISTRSQVPPPEGYLEKPVRAEDLLSEVKKHIG
jgi:CheY-like chemotaxis protein